MASTIFGATVWQSTTNPVNYRTGAAGKNSEVITSGDPLTVASGVIKVVSAATDPIIGVAAKTQTMGAANQTINTSTVYPLYTPADENVTFLMGCNTALTGNSTDVGKYFGLTGATGAVQVNVSGSVTTTTSRQVVIVKVDPYGLGTTEGLSEVLVNFFNAPSRDSN
jgi:hypothetical protein